MVVVDSSIWIDAHRRPNGRIATALNQLLDADLVVLALPVRLELLAGVSRRDRRTLERGLSALPLLRPSPATWAFIERCVPAAADKGFRFGVADWLIVALAEEIDALIWSSDSDFAMFERLELARLYAG